YREGHIADTSWLYWFMQHRRGLLAHYDGAYAEARDIFDDVAQGAKRHGVEDFSFGIDQVIAYGNYYEKVDSLDKALVVFDEGIAACKAINTPYAEDRLGVLYFNKAGAISKQGNLLDALGYSQLGADYFFRYHDDTHLQAMIIYNNLGGDYLRVNNFPEAQTYLEKAYACFARDHGPEETPGDVILVNLGICYSKTGDTERAVKAFEQAIATRTKVYGPDHIRTAMAQFNASSMYVELDRPEETIRLLNKCRATIAGIAGPTHPYVGSCDDNLGVAYRVTKEYDKALAAYQSALRIRKVNYPEGHINFATLMRNLSHLHLVQGNYSKALEWIEQAMAIEEENLGKESPRTAYIRAVYAHTLFESGQRESAYAAYAAAFHRYGLQSAEARDFAQLDDPKATMVAIGFFLDDAWSGYLKDRDREQLDPIIARAKQGIALLEWQRDKFSGDQIKALWTHKNYRLYEYLIVASLEIYERTQDQALVEEAAAYAERAKSSILLDALLKSGVSSFAGVPDELVRQGAKLKNELNFLELTLRDADAATLPAKQQAVFAKQAELDDYDAEIKRQYPKYHALFSAVREEQLEARVADLPAETALISYFLGSDYLVAFVQTADRFDHVRTPIDTTFFQELEAFIAGLQTPPALEAYGVDTTHLSRSAMLYRQLVAPLKHLIPEEVTQLLIIPDGVLHYLPFSVLIDPEEGQTLAAPPQYLLRDYSVSYAPSKAVWQNMCTAAVAPKGILTVAPTFSVPARDTADVQVTQRTLLGPLTFNEREAERVGAFAYSFQLYGADATLSNFNDRVHLADILHLATHAKVEANDNGSSYLAFSGAGPEAKDGKLFLSTVYDMELPLNMVVLSACETGLGELRYGEGFMSLARGFTYAGAKSIVPSLWAVNDLSTATIMEDYYAQLAEGLAKDEALRAAKLAYLDNNDDREAHPYFWAPFVVVGDASPVTFYRGYSWWWLGAVAFGVVALGYLVRRRQGDRSLR
ncbi:MAG: CHAT domain-containing tetratricopeptide repeat protein, partial [Bacteroidota bacterium]